MLFNSTVSNSPIFLCSFLVALLAGCGGGGVDEVSQRRVTQSMPQEAEIALPNVQFVSLVKTREVRVGRTEFEYDFTVQVVNTGAAAANVKLAVAQAPVGTTVVRGDAVIGDIGEGQHKASTSSITLRHDRTKPFSASDLRWAVMMAPTLNAAGTDRDGNGIRDDIDSRIRTIAGGRPEVEAAMNAFARNLQRFVDSVDTVDKTGARSLVLEELRTGWCIRVAVGGGQAKAQRDEIFWSTFDTATRRSKRQQVLDRAGTFALPEEEPSCA